MSIQNEAEDRRDYLAFLDEYGFTEPEIQVITQNPLDQVPMPPQFKSVELAPSNIHGMGIFAARDVREGEWLAPARLNWMRTPAGRYTNHAKHPNCVLVPLPNGDIWLVAGSNVPSGGELTVSYRQAGEVNGHHRPRRSSP